VFGVIFNAQVKPLFLISSMMTGATLFLLGVSKSKFSYAKWYWQGLESFMVGVFAATATFLIGYGLDSTTGAD
jgi:VIT1/CCC1 family predicted Fe2+/Mn2+ transporter